jgi:hypothetical protein
MYVVIFEEQEGIFGTFRTRNEAEDYINATPELKGKVVELIRPWSLGREILCTS